MERLAAAHQQYEDLHGFPSEFAELQFLEAKRIYTAKRKAFHLAHPEIKDLDVLSYEEGQLLDFIHNFPVDPLEAAIALWGAITKHAEVLAEEDAEDADYDTIMEAL